MTRPALDDVDHRLAVAFGAWMIVGLFIDGWAHDNNRPESFFTPWHGILYSGFLASTAAAIWSVQRHRRLGGPLRGRIPVGHGLTLASLVVFGVGGVGDLLWHETLGVEVGVEALLSPTHLLLLIGGLVLLTAPIRSSWSDSGSPTTLRDFLGPLLSASFAMGVVGFFLVYLSPFVNRAAASRFERRAGDLHDHPATDPAELLQLLGVASILTTTVIVVLGVQLVLRRWPHPPARSFTLMLGVVIVLFVALDEFAQPSLLVMGVVAGATADVAVRRLPGWATGVAATLALWTTYFALSGAFEGGVAWTAELWAGVTVLAAMLAAGIGLVANPPRPA